MVLKTRLASLRRSRSLSQEALAEELSVSRQAVAKWESGETLPELENLVALASFYSVSVDSLLRGGTCGEADNGTQVRGDEVLLRDFLCKAKRETYAGKGPESVPSRLASHDLSFEEGDLFYYDTYLGGERFIGEEGVWRGGKPWWGMNYCGRVLSPQRFPADFLKEALFAVAPEQPYRGPSVYEKGDFAYHSMVSGALDWYRGSEEILVSGERVYECLFHGGFIG